MLTLEQFSQLAAVISAMADVFTVGRDTFSNYLRARENDTRFTERGIMLQSAFGTYSDSEVDSIKRRIENCRDRFIAEGGGTGRKTCLCSVLTDVKDGNGGVIPDPDWARTFEQLGCAA